MLTLFVRPRDIQTQQLAALKADDKLIYTPDYQRWGGLNDKFAFDGANAMLNVYMHRLDGFKAFEAARSQLKVRTRQDSTPLNGETYLKQTLADHGIQNKDTSMRVLRVRANGSVAKNDRSLAQTKNCIDAQNELVPVHIVVV